MAVVTNEGGAPSIVGHKALLAQLSTAMVANGWTLLASSTGGAEDTYYFRGPNISVGASTVNVHINIRTWTSAVSGYYNWEIRGARGYDSGVTFENQPGTFQTQSGEEQLVPTLTLNNSNITYWFIINDRRVIVMAKVDGRYANMYAGFILPYATPSEYPFPMYVAGSAGSYITTDSQGDYNLGSCFDPMDESARLQHVSGNWEIVANYQRTASKSTTNASTQSYGRVSTWPYRTQSLIFSLLHLSHSGDATPIYPLIPIIIFSRITNETNLFGELDGIYYTPGVGAAPEDSFTISSEDYIVTQSMYRSNTEDFAVIKRV